MNKIIIVTGASTGIGRAIAIEFGKEKATLFLVARRLEELQKTKEMVENVGGKADIFQCDLSDLTSVNNLIDSLHQKTNKIDALINVAGIWHGKNEVFAGKDLENFDQKIIIDTYMVGLIAPTLLVHRLLDILVTGDGKVINISGTFEN